MDKSKANNQNRKSLVQNAGARIMQNNSNNRVTASSSLKNFPTDQEIEQFQAQLNSESIKSLATSLKNEKTTLTDKAVTYSEIQRFLNQNFEKIKPAESLIQALFERFKPFKFEGSRENTTITSDNEMVILDFIIALCLLARIVYEKKLKLLFELCDDDDDGCMTPEDILNMLQKVERVFAQECSRVDLESTVLNNFVADKKAEVNFHFIMGMIKQQNLKKNVRLKLLNEKANAESGKKNDDDNQKASKDEEEDNLITYREFINAIQSSKQLYKTILPRTLSFKEVLNTRKFEIAYYIADTHLDDFAMFRYELNSIIKKHQFDDEPVSDLFMGRHPLSKTKDGKQIKNLDDKPRDDKGKDGKDGKEKECKEKYWDVYRPPGLIKINEDTRYFMKEGSAATAAGQQKGYGVHTGQQQSQVPMMLEFNEQKTQGNKYQLEKKNDEKWKQQMENIWNTIPQKTLYQRVQKVSEYEKNADEVRYSKYESSMVQSNQKGKQQKKEDNKEGKDKAGDKDDGKEGKESKDGGDQKEQKATRKTVKITDKKDQQQSEGKKYDDLFKINLYTIDPNKVEIDQMYQDQLPPVTKQLKKFVDEDIKEMNAFNQSQNFDFELKNKKWKEMVRRMTEDILPEEGRDYKKISKLRVQQFEQEDEKARARQQRDNAINF